MKIFKAFDKRRFYAKMGGYAFWFMMLVVAYGVLSGSPRWHPEWFYAAWLAYFFLYFGLAWIIGTKIKSQFKQLLIAYGYLIAGAIFLLW